MGDRFFISDALKKMLVLVVLICHVAELTLLFASLYNGDRINHVCACDVKMNYRFYSHIREFFLFLICAVAFVSRISLVP